MKQYRVRWIIDIEADSPTDAAVAAQAIQRDPNSTATVFDVLDVALYHDERHLKVVTVDLSKEQS
jgi:hypothetical protein